MKKFSRFLNLFSKKEKYTVRNIDSENIVGNYSFDGIDRRRKARVTLYSGLVRFEKIAERNFLVRTTAYATVIMLLFSLFNFASAKFGDKPALQIPKDVVQDELIIKYRNINDTGLTTTERNSNVLFKEKVFDNEDLSSVRAKYSARAVRATSTKESYGLENIVKVKVKQGTNIAELLRKYQADPNVEYAQYSYVYKALYTIGDPYYTDTNSPFYQWDVDNISLPAALNQTTGSANNVIAVLDSGIRATHEELTGKILAGYDFVNNQAIAAGTNSDDMHEDYQYTQTDSFEVGHGTAVAGTIGAIGNSTGIIGVTQANKIMPVKVLSSAGSGSPIGIAKGIKYAVDNGADILNLSLGGGSELNPVYSRLISDVLQYAHDSGAVTIAAAGNDETIDVGYMSPANDPNVITVGASDNADAIGSFSTMGQKIDVVAPGVWVPVPGNDTDANANNTYGLICGTSFSAPIVAGITGLMLAKNPALTNEQIRQILRSSADDKGASGFDTTFGYGRVDANAAVTASASPSVSTAYMKAVMEPKTSFTFAGSAFGTKFSSYKLEYGSTVAPSSWTQISTSSTPVTNGTLATWNAAALADGNYTVRLTVTNNDQTTATSTMYVAVDSSQPIVTINSPQNVKVNNPTITGIATASTKFSNNKIEYIGYLLDQTSGSLTSVPITPAASINYSIPLNNLSPGLHSLFVAAEDSNYNSTKQENYNFIYFNVDLTAPAAPVISSPANGAIVSTSTVTVSGTAEVNSTVEVFNGSTSAGTVDVNYLGNWTKTGVAINGGANTIKARATDKAGNVGAYAQITVTKNTGPYLDLVPASSTLTAGTASTIAITAKATDGSTNTNYTGTVHFTSSDSQAVLPADHAYTTNDNGVHSFPITLKTAGAQTITATDTNGGFEANFTVSPASATTLTKVSGDNQSATVYRSLGSPLVVKATDTYNNPVPDVSLAVAIVSGGGGVPANSIVTGADGKASTSFRMGATAGANQLTISGFSQSVTFNATATAFPYNVTKDGGSSTPIKSPNEQFQVIFDPNAASENLNVVVSQLDTTPASSSGTKVISGYYDVVAEKETTGYQTTFSTPIRLSVKYDSSLASQVDIDSAKLYFWDTNTNSWSQVGVVTTGVDKTNNVITGTTNHLSSFAIIANDIPAPTNNNNNNGGTSGNNTQTTRTLPVTGINSKFIVEFWLSILLGIILAIFQPRILAFSKKRINR